jgi:CheY-like chemotaxis protein
MNRVLIVASAQPTGEMFRQALGQEGWQTAVVWTPQQMVEFCRQHSPDSLVVDLNLVDQGLWTAVQAVRALGTLANVPMVGLVPDGQMHLAGPAEAAYFQALCPMSGGGAAVIAALRGRGSVSAAASFVSPLQVTGRDPSLNQLREITREIIQVSERLRRLVDEYGEDGPEHFRYIDDAGVAICRKLNDVADFSLHDRELRHDFRNMIASVTGFAELIMMEPDLSDESIRGLTRLRELSRKFIEILDLQKADMTA